ncbi:trypsin-like serine protease [Photobacterium jeanii]|nr:trypsin-like serine protease [Photobacterium jeanii]
MPKIMNGEKALKDLLPWQVMVYGKKEGTLCGGSVIADKWIVTAGHCVTDFTEAGNKAPLLSPGDLVFAGTTNPHTALGYLDERKAVKIKQLIVHDKYFAISFENDIALIEVDSSLYAKGSKRIVLANTKEMQADIDRSFKQHYVANQNSKATVIASGWGLYGSKTGMPDDLQVVKLAGIPDDQCKANKYPAEHFVCADSNRIDVKKDVCRGDSGGPLIWQDPSHTADSDKGLRLIGATSNGPLCSEKHHDRAIGNGLYTQISHHYQWIKDQTQLDFEKLPLPAYQYDPFKVVKDTPSVKPDPKKPDPEGNGGSIAFFSSLLLAIAAWRRRNF